MQQLGLSGSDFYTNMSGLKGKFSSNEYAGELRNAQASKWAFRSVAEGIEHFKEGRHSEAFQCLNKALSIDPRNVEGLVARGALYANSGSFKKAVDDFEAALKINSAHANARKYMGETLVALGRSYEEENRLDEAKKAYQDCLNIIPHHEEAQNSLDFLKSKTFNKQIVAPNELELPALNLPKPLARGDHLKNAEPDTSGVAVIKRDGSEARRDKKALKIKDKKKRHKKTGAAGGHSSSSDSSSESDSSDSSSNSDSSSSDSTSDSDSSRSSRPKKRQKRSKNEKKLKSLSPLSKRMGAGMGNDARGGDGPFSFGSTAPVAAATVTAAPPTASHSSAMAPQDEYELKVRKFLEMTHDEDNYEEKVRRFMAEAAKYTKERKAIEEKSKKKKKKEEKKAKKESKKKRKSEEKKKGKKKDKDEDPLNSDKLKEALKIFENFPVLDELGSKLSEYYAKMDGSAGPSGVSSVMSSLLSKTTKKEGAVKDEPKVATKVAKEGQPKDGKWRMMFNKDERAAVKETTATKPFVPKQYAFANDSDDESVTAVGFTPAPPPQQKTTRIVRYEEDKNRRKPLSPEKPKPSVSQMAPVKSGPVVLDKFGNFRLANAEDAAKPPEPAAPPRRSRSRSRGQRYGSSSGSGSDSPRRRSRSGSFSRRRSSRSRSRSFSNSRSRSYSRSRSRSRSFERRRFIDRRNQFNNNQNFRGRGNFYNRPYGNYQNWNNRGNFMHRRGGYNNNFRGGYHHQYQNRPFRFHHNNRYQNYNNHYNNNNQNQNRRYNHNNRSFSRSESKSDRDGSPDERRKDRSRSNDRSTKRSSESFKGKDKDLEKPVSVDSDDNAASSNWSEKKVDHDPPPPGAEDSSVDDVERILDKVRKEKKDD